MASALRHTCTDIHPFWLYDWVVFWYLYPKAYIVLLAGMDMATLVTRLFSSLCYYRVSTGKRRAETALILVETLLA